MSETQKKLENLPLRTQLQIERPLEISIPPQVPTNSLRKSKIPKSARYIFVSIIIASFVFLWVNHRMKIQNKEAIAPSEFDKLSQLNAEALQTYRNQGPAAAEPLLTKLIEAYPDNAPLLANLGVIYLALEQYNKAEKVLLKALTSDPENAKFLTNLGSYYMEKNSLEKATEYFNKALEFNPNEPAALINRGILFERNSQWVLALRDYENYLQQSKNESTSQADLLEIIQERLRIIRSLAYMSQHNQEANHAVQ